MSPDEVLVQWENRAWGDSSRPWPGETQLAEALREVIKQRDEWKEKAEWQLEVTRAFDARTEQFLRVVKAARQFLLPANEVKETLAQLELNLAVALDDLDSGIPDNQKK